MAGDKKKLDVSYKIQKNIEQSLDLYNAWIYEKIAPFLGQRIFDAGCSVGNITKFYINKDFVYGVDISKAAISELKAKYKTKKNFKAKAVDLANLNSREFKQYKFNTIVCINVLEHIKDDKKLIRMFNKILPKNGKLILDVPAFNFLFGEMDKADNHYRRYTKSMLRKTFIDSGFTLKKQFYFNFFGIPGWFINGRILKKSFIDPKNYKFYNILVPTFKIIEKFVRFPIGLSIISIYEKTDDI